MIFWDYLSAFLEVGGLAVIVCLAILGLIAWGQCW